MGLTLNGFVANSKIKLVELLQELYDTEAFQNKFMFNPGQIYSVETEPFLDSYKNKIQVGFIEDGNSSYEVDFTVNGYSGKAPNVKYSVKDTAQLLKTVAKVIDQFLVDYKPGQVKFTGTDSFKKIINNPLKKGQKNKNFQYLISQLSPNSNYLVGREGDYFFVQRK
jgi:hypothetical protein